MTPTRRSRCARSAAYFSNRAGASAVLGESTSAKLCAAAACASRAVSLPSGWHFSRSTTREVSEALDKLKGEGMQQLLLDLRSNGGGLLDQTVAVSKFFVPEKSRIVETRGRLRDSHQTFLSEDGDEMLDIPLVVLVNNGTASAAEILAGAIQDHDIGLVVGQSSFGKGSVQTVFELTPSKALKLTVRPFSASSRILGKALRADAMPLGMITPYSPNKPRIWLTSRVR